MTKRPKASDHFATEDGPEMRSGRAPLHKFVPYPNNPRTHPPAEIVLLAEILKNRGADQNIVVDEDWVILKGHGRLEAAKVAGMLDFPYVQRLGLTEAEKLAIRIEDNAVPLLAGWDRELIAGEIATLKSQGYELSMLGFGDAQLVQFTTTPGPPDEFPSVGENIETKHQCPKCGYRWSGSSAPTEKKVAAPRKRKGKK
jgi:ParB-like nuclease family protein